MPRAPRRQQGRVVSPEGRADGEFVQTLRPTLLILAAIAASASLFMPFLSNLVDTVPVLEAVVLQVRAMKHCRDPGDPPRAPYALGSRRVTSTGL